jgi:hypothetical protein
MLHRSRNKPSGFHTDTTAIIYEMREINKRKLAEMRQKLGKKRKGEIFLTNSHPPRIIKALEVTEERKKPT